MSVTSKTLHNGNPPGCPMDGPYKFNKFPNVFYYNREEADMKTHACGFKIVDDISYLSLTTIIQLECKHGHLFSLPFANFYDEKRPTCRLCSLKNFTAVSRLLTDTIIIECDKSHKLKVRHDNIPYRCPVCDIVTSLGDVKLVHGVWKSHSTKLRFQCLKNGCAYVPGIHRNVQVDYPCHGEFLMSSSEIGAKVVTCRGSHWKKPEITQYFILRILELLFNAKGGQGGQSIQSTQNSQTLQTLQPPHRFVFTDFIDGAPEVHAISHELKLVIYWSKQVTVIEKQTVEWYQNKDYEVLVLSCEPKRENLVRDIIDYMTRAGPRGTKKIFGTRYDIEKWLVEQMDEFGNRNTALMPLFS